MSGPYCESCKYFNPQPFSGGECSDPAKIMFYGKGDAVNGAPDVMPDWTCRNWTSLPPRTPAKTNTEMSVPADPFLDTPDLRAERLGPNPRYHWCHDCGWRWETGKSGNHDCAGNLRQQREALQKRCVEAEKNVRIANGNHEHFERLWYLRGDEMELLSARCATLETALQDRETSLQAAEEENTRLNAQLNSICERVYKAVPMIDGTHGASRRFDLLVDERDALKAGKQAAEEKLDTILTDVDYEGGIPWHNARYNKLLSTSLELIQKIAETEAERDAWRDKYEALAQLKPSN